MGCSQVQSDHLQMIDNTLCQSLLVTGHRHAVCFGQCMDQVCSVQVFLLANVIFKYKKPTPNKKRSVTLPAPLRKSVQILPELHSPHSIVFLFKKSRFSRALLHECCSQSKTLQDHVIIVYVRCHIYNMSSD